MDRLNGTPPWMVKLPNMADEDLEDVIAFLRSDELPGVAVPEETFAGVAGVAPSHEQLELFRALPGRPPRPCWGRIERERQWLHSRFVRADTIGPPSRAGNDTIAAKLRDAGFSEIKVEGSGGARQAEALWPGPDTTAEMPSQITEVIEV
jgi:hypothetical protein